MARSIHVRLDDDADAALTVLRNGGLTDSGAVRIALREAGERRRTRAALASEVHALAHDETDLAEAEIVRGLMADLTPNPSD